MSADELRKTDEYQKVMQQWGTGSDLQRGIQAATAAIQGLAGGDVGKALAGASAPYVAEVIHNMTTDASGKVNQEANLMAHAVLGAVVAKVNGNSALAGASGASLGEYIAQQLYPDIPRDKLSEDQKQTISALGTLAAGLVGGITGDSTADAVAGAQAGKTSVENNALGTNQLSGFAEKARSCTGDSCQQVVRDMINQNVEQQEEIKVVCATSPQQCQEKYGYLIEQWHVFEETVKHMAADGTLPPDFKNALAPVYSLGIEAEGILANQGWAERFEAMGFGEEAATAMAATLPALTSGTKGGKASGPKVPPKLEPFKNPAQGPVIPSGWVSRPGRTEGSTIYFPAGTDPSKPGSTYIRVMPPGSTPVPGLENGYWISVKSGQPINPATGGTGTRGETHVPLPPNTMPPKR